MNKIRWIGLSFLLVLMCACGDSGTSTGDGRSETLIDPSDPNALSQALVIPGATRMQGSPPATTGGLDAPVIASVGVRMGRMCSLSVRRAWRPAENR